MKKYILTQQERPIAQCDGDDECLREEFLYFESRQILVWQMQSDLGAMSTIVPGYVASRVFKNKYGLSAVNCERIPRDKKQDLEKQLRELSFQGPININLDDQLV